MYWRKLNTNVSLLCWCCVLRKQRHMLPDVTTTMVTWRHNNWRKEEWIPDEKSGTRFIKWLDDDRRLTNALRITSCLMSKPKWGNTKSRWRQELLPSKAHLLYFFPCLAATVCFSVLRKPSNLWFLEDGECDCYLAYPTAIAYCCLRWMLPASQDFVLKKSFRRHNTTQHNFKSYSHKLILSRKLQIS